MAITASLTRADEATMMTMLGQLAGFERHAMDNGPVLIGIGSAFTVAQVDGLQPDLAALLPSVAKSFGTRLMNQAIAIPMTVSIKR